MIRGPLPNSRLVQDLREGLDLGPIIYLGLIEFVFQRLQCAGVGHLLQFGLVVVGLEGAENVFGFVDEIEDERRVLAGDHPVQTR